MKLFQPIEVLDAVLTSSNVVETPPAAWSNLTTYAVAATASVAGANGLRDVYTSLQAVNLNHPPASSPTWWKLTGRTYGVYSGAATYAAGERAIAVAADSHHTYESLIAGNVGNAVTDATKWLDLGATNQRVMFDGAVQSQTTNPDTIVVALQPSARFDTLSLQNIAAATAHVVQTDPVAGVVFDETFSLVSTDGITDWSAYFDEPIVRMSDLTVRDLRRLSGTTLTVTLADAGADVACGALLFGRARNIGNTAWGAQVGITDFSTKERDAFGNTSITERAYFKLGSFNLFVPANLVDGLQILLADLRATPVVIIGDDDYTATAIYGFVRSFNIAIDYPDVSLCSLDFEGLV